MNAFHSIALALICVCLASPAQAQAQSQLGPLNNVFLKNPHPNPEVRQYGSSVVSGDFDGDGIDDLAISEKNGTRLRILLGVGFPVGTRPSSNFNETTVTLPDLGPEMASGDFDGDGRDEIAVGAFNTASGGVSGAGEVYVINRLVNGSWSVQSTIHTGGNYPGALEVGASFGYSLSAGDFNDDGFVDLAIGIRNQTVAGVDDAGAVMITYGGSSGITSAQAQIINRSSDGLNFVPSDSDRYGWAVAAGDFDGDGDDDLAIGILNGTCPNGIDRSGAVVVLDGSPAVGISNADSHIWRPGILGIAGNCSTSGGFGSALAAGNFGPRGIGDHAWDDLVVGAPGTNSDAGVVHIIHGSSMGLDSAGSQRLIPPALPGIISGDGHFGSVVAVGMLNTCVALGPCTGDSLAVGAPFATINGTSGAGAVWVFNATFSGTFSVVSPLPIVPLLPLGITSPHTDDRFGTRIGIGDFNDDGRVDIAIGTPFYDDGVQSGVGAVQVLYQSERIFVDGFE